MIIYKKLILPDFTPQNTDTTHIINNKEQVDHALVDQKSDNHLSTIIEPEDAIISVNPPQQAELEVALQESYEQGYNEATKYWQEILEHKEQVNNFANILTDKLQGLSNIAESQIDQLSAICVQMLLAVARKLPLIFPVNFEQVLTDNILALVKNFQHTGKIIIKVHSDRVAYCKQLLETQNIIEETREQLQVINDPAMQLNDCQIEWADSKITYNSEEITNQAIEILSSLLLSNINN